jgi:hypothetical protein
MLYNIIRNSHFLQNSVINFISGIHPSILHNIGKIEIIKKALFHATTEQLEGSYFEFGVFEGASLLSAVKSYNKMSKVKIVDSNLKKIDRNFYGFDSFDEGFKYIDERDRHPFFKEGDFVSSYIKCKKRLSKHKNVKLIKGYFDDSVKDKNVKKLVTNEKCSVIFIDCDLMVPAITALNFIKPALQKGSIIILDDYFAYKGNPMLGTSGALKKFLLKNKSIKVREFFRYGYNGASFVVYAV